MAKRYRGDAREGHDDSFRSPRRGKPHKKGVEGGPNRKARNVGKNHRDVNKNSSHVRRRRHHHYSYRAHKDGDAYVPRISIRRDYSMHRDGDAYVPRVSIKRDYSIQKDGDAYVPRISIRRDYSMHRDGDAYVPRRLHKQNYDIHNDGDEYVPRRSHKRDYDRDKDGDAYVPRKSHKRDYDIREDGDAYVPRRSHKRDYDRDRDGDGGFYFPRTTPHYYYDVNRDPYVPHRVPPYRYGMEAYNGKTYDPYRTSPTDYYYAAQGTAPRYIRLPNTRHYVASNLYNDIKLAPVRKQRAGFARFIYNRF